MLKKLDSVLFFFINLALYLFFLYGSIITNHSISIIFIFIGFLGVLWLIMEVYTRICRYQGDKRIEKYIASGFKKWKD